jgi:hypothetical protein
VVGHAAEIAPAPDASSHQNTKADAKPSRPTALVSGPLSFDS